MRNWLTDTAALLAANSSGSLILASNLFVGEIAETASLESMATLLYPSTGAVELGRGLHQVSLQITQRCRSYAQAWAEAWRVYEWFVSNPGPHRLGSSPYTLLNEIQPVSPPFPIGRDETGSWRIVCNYDLDLLAE